MKAVFICKGIPISHISLILENGKEYNYTWIRKIKNVGYILYNIIKSNNLEIISRSYDIDIFKQETGYNIKYIHIKDYYMEKTNTTERLDRFTMCGNLDIKINSHETRNSRDTAKTYWKIINKL